VAARGRALIALAGGGTPRPLYRRLTEPPYRRALSWERLHFFWGDERLVPPEDPGSNYGQFVELIGELADRASLHRVRGELELGAAAAAYTRELAAVAEGEQLWPRFDLVLLGLGSDGHTASLFPGQRDPAEDTAPVLAVTGEYEDRPAQRVTLTPALFNDAAHVIFLVSGDAKAEAVRAALQEKVRPVERPAQRIRPANSRVTWFLDRAAASLLSAA
jgi:6-phosphogluconolactonase